MQDSFEKLKRSVSEWVISLDTTQYDMKQKIALMEKRLARLEDMHGKFIKGDIDEF